MASERISPTAHYTSYVWFKHGLSHPALTTRVGRVLHAALRPVNLAYERMGSRPSLDMMLLARHRMIDHLLEGEIAAGRVGQVLEVAAGYSPRGFRMTRRFPALRYVEADLPPSAERKRAVLTAAGLTGRDHRVVAVDALADSGPLSLAAVAAANLDPKLGTAVITEGLLGYFDEAAVRGMWRRFATLLGSFPSGVYLSDLNLGEDTDHMRGARAFRTLLGMFARGKVYLHFAGEAAALAALGDAGFQSPRLVRAEDLPAIDLPGRERGHFVRVIAAR